MNHITWLTQERATALATIEGAKDELDGILAYLCSDKFAWPDSDYVHVRTDIMPKLLALRSALLG